MSPITHLLAAIVLAFSAVGFFRTMDLIEARYGRKVALIVTLLLGALAIIGFCVHPIHKV